NGLDVGGRHRSLPHGWVNTLMVPSQHPLRHSGMTTQRLPLVGLRRSFASTTTTHLTSGYHGSERVMVVGCEDGRGRAGAGGGSVGGAGASVRSVVWRVGRLGAWGAIRPGPAGRRG